MSDVSPRPWKLVFEDRFDEWLVKKVKHALIFDAHNFHMNSSEDNLNHMIKCVNEYDSLVERAEKYKEDAEKMNRMLRRAIERAEKAEEMLRKALEACEHCPNKDGVCGESCSIRHIKEWAESEAKGDEQP